MDIDLDILTLKTKSINELELLAKFIQSTEIPELTSHCNNFVKSIQEDLLSIENKTPELKNFGSFSKIENVQLMLSTIGSGQYEAQIKNLNVMMATLDSNYKPPIQSEEQINFIKKFEIQGKQYLLLNDRINNAKNRLTTINNIIAHKKNPTPETPSPSSNSNPEPTYCGFKPGFLK